MITLLDTRLVGPPRRQILREQLYLESDANAPIRLSVLMDALRRTRTQYLRDSRTQNRPPLALTDLQPQVEAILGNAFKSTMTVDVVIPRRVISGSEYARFFFSFAVRYLGPLRDEPKPIYPLEALLNPTEVGYKGEHTAAVLHLHRDTYIQYVPSSFVENLDKPPAFVTATLHSAVVDWLAYMGVVEEFTTEDLGKIGHNLQVQTQGNPQLYDLTNVGVGVSQVLPIVVMALLAERPCFLIFEQPELQLHPKVQARLGDFFLSVGLSGKQCLVETHSEYLVERFRRRIAEAPGSDLVGVLKIYFTDRSQGMTICRPVDVSRFGAISDYPSDFVDQAQDETEAILQAARAKRSSEKAAEAAR